MKAFSLQESTEERASARNESVGAGAGGDKADLLHSKTVSIFRQLQFLLSSRSCRNIPSVRSAHQKQGGVHRGEGADRDAVSRLVVRY